MRLVEKLLITSQSNIIKHFQITISCTLCFLNYVCISQNPNPSTDWQKEDLICKASKLRTVFYSQEEKFGELTDIGIDSISIVYNNDGNYQSKFKYNIRSKWYLNCKKEGYKDCSLNSIQYDYDANCLTRIGGITDDNKSYYTYYKCSNGLIQSASYYFDNNIEEKYEYQYDVNGNNTRFELYKIGGYGKSAVDETIETIWLYEYNTNKQIIASKKYNGEGKLTDSFKFKYDLAGNFISRERFVHSNKIELKEKATYTYNNKNIILTENVNNNVGSAGSESSSVSYIYIFNPNGTIKQKTKKNSYYTEYTIKYILYDNKGNWIEKTTINSSGKSFKEKRVIEY